MTFKEFRKINFLISKKKPEDAVPKYLDGFFQENTIITRPFQASHFKGKPLQKQFRRHFTRCEDTIYNTDNNFDTTDPKILEYLNKKRQAHNRFTYFSIKAKEKYKTFSKDFRKRFDYTLLDTNYALAHLFVKNDEAGIKKVLKEYSRISTDDLAYKLMGEKAKEYLDEMNKHFGIFRAEKPIRRQLFSYWYAIRNKNQDGFPDYRIPVIRKDGVIQHYWKKLSSKRYRDRTRMDSVRKDAYYNTWGFDINLRG
jgi:hypothetical protein